MKTTIAMLLAAPFMVGAFAVQALAADRAEGTVGDDPAAYHTIRSGDLKAAEKELSAEKDPFQMLNLAYVMQKTGRSDQAAELYKKILKMDQNPYAKMASGEPRRVKAIARDGLAYLDQEAD